MRKILLVDDEIRVLHALQRAIRQGLPPMLPQHELQLEMFVNPFDALTRCGECHFDMVISDFRMPEMSGVEFLHALKLAAPDTVRVMLSASTEYGTVLCAVNEAEVFRYLAKPWHPVELEACIVAALQQHDRIREERGLANLQRLQSGVLSAQEFEARQLESQCPGITRVTRADDGAIIL